MNDARFASQLFTQESEEEWTQKKQSQRRSNTNAAAHLPSYIDKEIWSAFVETRKAMKVPFTDAAQRLIIRQLMKLHESGWDANASLEKSAIYGYRGVFEVAKRPLETKEQTPARQVSDDHLKAAVPMPKEIRDRIKELTRQF